MHKRLLIFLSLFTLCFNQSFGQLASIGLQRLALPAQIIEFENSIGGKNIGDIVSYCIDHGKGSPTSYTPENTYKYFPVDEKCVYVDNMPPISFAEAIASNLLSITTENYDKIILTKKTDKKIKIIISELVVPSPEENFTKELLIPKSLLTTKKEDIKKNQTEIWERQKLYEIGKLDKSSIDNEKLVEEAKKKVVDDYFTINKSAFSNLLDYYTKEIELLQNKNYLKKGIEITPEAISKAKEIEKIAIGFPSEFDYRAPHKIIEFPNTFFISKSENSTYYLFDNNKTLLIENGHVEDIIKYVQENTTSNETIQLIGNNFESFEKLEAFTANIEIRIKSESGNDLSIISNTVSNLYEGNEQISILSSEYYQHKLTKSLTDNDIKEQSDGYTLTTFFDSKYLTYPIEKNTIELTAISKQKNVLINFKTYLNAKLSALKKVNLWTLLKTFRLDNKLKSSDIKYYVGSKAGKVNIGKINSRHLAESLLYAIR